MTTRIAINGFGRMGKLATRVILESEDLELVLINEPASAPEASAHLLTFDSIHGTWRQDVQADSDQLIIGDQSIAYSRFTDPAQLPLRDHRVDLVLECSGKFKTREKCQVFFDGGARKVVISAPIPDSEGLNIVMGVNDGRYDGSQDIVTAASCTTNCLAPVVKVIHEGIGIKHGSMTTIHDITNTQTIIDKGHKDLRRARACQMSLIPTTTGSAKVITSIFPELKGKLNGIAVRVPVLNASITDCVFEVERSVTVEEVNHLLKQAAAEGPLAGILGFETRPLVSVDYKSDPRSAIVDALSTMVINETQVKLLVWYDNEMGYVHRMVELARKVATA